MSRAKKKDQQNQIQEFKDITWSYKKQLMNFILIVNNTSIYAKNNYVQTITNEIIWTPQFKHQQ